MGDMFSSKSASQSTVNNQVGVQGGVGIGAGAINYGRISVENSDIRALSNVIDLGKMVVGSNRDVSLSAINGANITANNALQTLQSVGGKFADLASNAVATSQQIAAQAAPVSEGNIIESANHNAQVITYVAIGGAVLLALAFISHHK